MRTIELLYRERVRSGRFDPARVSELKERLARSLSRSRDKDPLYPLVFFELLVNPPRDRAAVARALDRFVARHGKGSEHVEARRILEATRALLQENAGSRERWLESLKPVVEGSAPAWAELHGTRALLQWRLGRPQQEIAATLELARRERALPLGAPWTWPGYVERVIAGEAWWPGDKWAEGE